MLSLRDLTAGASAFQDHTILSLIELDHINAPPALSVCRVCGPILVWLVLVGLVLPSGKQGRGPLKGHWASCK